jgi:hypothetical protein
MKKFLVLLLLAACSDSVAPDDRAATSTVIHDPDCPKCMEHKK